MQSDPSQRWYYGCPSGVKAPTNGSSPVIVGDGVTTEFDTCCVQWAPDGSDCTLVTKAPTKATLTKYTGAVCPDIGSARATFSSGNGYANEVACTYNNQDLVLAGPQGPKGDTGLQGPMGPQGLKGDTGLQGPMGPQGIKGDTGLQGPIGPQGLKGDTGLQGPMGPQGIKGDIGPQGPQGLKGDTGLQGPMGPQGIKGDTGLQGPMGPQGLKGDTGLQGPMGPQGPQGPQGLKGDTGLQGPKGNIGPAGKDCDSVKVDTDLKWLALGVLIIGGGLILTTSYAIYKNNRR